MVLFTCCSIAIFTLSEGMNYYHVKIDKFLYIVLNGYVIDKVRTTAAANRYAYQFIGISILPILFAYYFYRKFLKTVPIVE